MNVDHGRLDHLRAAQGPVENHVIDEFVAGRISRRDFLRRGAVVGISVPVLGAVLAACGSSSPTPAAQQQQRAGRHVRGDHQGRDRGPDGGDRPADRG